MSYDCDVDRIFTDADVLCVCVLCPDSCQPLKMSCLQGKPSPPLPPKKLMLYSSSPVPLSFGQKAPALVQYGHPLQLQYGAVHPSSRIIDELQKTLALAMQRLDRCVSSGAKTTIR